MVVGALVAGLALALMHAFAGTFSRVGSSRRRWLSVGGGISVAYVFLHLLPELAAGARNVGRAAPDVGIESERHVWLLVLAGLLAFHAVEGHSRRRARGGEGGDGAGTSVAFWTSIGSFASYNAVVGYLLVGRAAEGALELATFTFAMLLHFAVNDSSLGAHHHSWYDRVGRWLLAAAVGVGLAVRLLVELPEAAVTALVALLAGGVVLNALKEELSVEREGSLAWFLLGALGYGALLLAL